MSPAYIVAFDATDKGEGADVATAPSLGDGRVGASPTPNANAPVVTWPSSTDTTRQVTV